MPKKRGNKGNKGNKGRKGNTGSNVNEGNKSSQDQGLLQTAAYRSASQPLAFQGDLEYLLTKENILAATKDPRNLQRTSGSHRHVGIMLPTGKHGALKLGTFAYTGHNDKSEIPRIIRQLGRRFCARFDPGDADGGSSAENPLVDGREQLSRRQEKTKQPHTKGEKAKAVGATFHVEAEKKPPKLQAEAPELQAETPEHQAGSRDTVLKAWVRGMRKIMEGHERLDVGLRDKRSVEAINKMSELLETFYRQGHDPELMSSILSDYSESVCVLRLGFVKKIVDRYKSFNRSPVRKTMDLVNESASYLKNLNFTKNNTCILESHVNDMIYKVILELIVDVFTYQISSEKVLPSSVVQRNVSEATEEDKMEGPLCHVIGEVVSVCCTVIDVCVDFNIVSNKHEMSGEHLDLVCQTLDLILVFCQSAVNRAEEGDDCENARLMALSEELPRIRKKVFHKLRRYYENTPLSSDMLNLSCLSFLYLEVKCIHLDIRNSVSEHESLRHDIPALIRYCKTLFPLCDKLTAETEEVRSYLGPQQKNTIETMDKSFDDLRENVCITLTFVLYRLMNAYQNKVKIDDAMIVASELVALCNFLDPHQVLGAFGAGFVKVLDSYFDPIKSFSIGSAGHRKDIFGSFSFESWSNALMLCSSLGRHCNSSFSQKPAIAIDQLYLSLKSLREEGAGISEKENETGLLVVAKMCSLLINQCQHVISDRDNTVYAAGTWVICMGSLNPDRQQVGDCLDESLNLFPVVSDALLNLEGKVELKSNIYKYIRNYYALIGKSKQHLRNMIRCGQPDGPLPDQIHELSERVFTHCAEVCERTKDSDELQETNGLLYNLYKIILFFVSVRQPLSANLSQLFMIFHKLEGDLKCSVGSEEGQVLLDQCAGSAFKIISEVTKDKCSPGYFSRIEAGLNTLSHFFRGSDEGASEVAPLAPQEQGKLRALKMLQVVTALPDFRKI